MGMISDAEVRDTLTKLARQLFPLESWVKDGQKYVPPNAPDLPWRGSGPTLSIESLRAVERLDLLIESDSNEALRVRWNKIATAPLWFEPSLHHPADWRAQHKLDEAAAFAPVDSENFVIATVDPKTKLKLPRARSEFYAACWPLLMKAQTQRVFPDDASWLQFAKNLLADELAAWPPTEVVKSSDFIKRFAKDVAICLLDLESPFLPVDEQGELWQRAVLIEAGEHRHRHNVYNPEQVQEAVAQFDAKVTALL
ncbi:MULTISPECIES: hypothetical protein [unclassified Mesorhizobium]|uniref:hypothetical protein n=1 Tax=unclassified Mesorhizobium TaxID=325217 RepID=UPI003338CEA7